LRNREFIARTPTGSFSRHPWCMASVDYEQIASTYQIGRSAVAHEDSWGPLVAPYLPGRPGLRVLDLGAGTGIFARVWPGWGADSVVALDPAQAMLAEARRSGLGERTWPVNARGEWLPLRDGSVDVVWISTVFHHLTDRRRCIDDLVRVLRGPGSAVMVRGMFPGRWSGGWHHLLPGMDRATQRFPRFEVVSALFAEAGFTLQGIEGVHEASTSGNLVAAWVRRMRDADTLLLQLTDEEIAAGLAVLDGIGEGTVEGPTLETAVYVL
jgi:SAM-dependent methyltransferase